ncbi:DNA mismatch repair protein Mlh3 [Geodia barretti]|uniref:DNA mismatch repair protein Mlh3 n=1 Tax=Geodia barretti TaxID=519541 RepID=A0AA35WSK7_GEOBA|nr:DNA mismatch repair protein Mlh3 [Geodia barretti]
MCSAGAIRFGDHLDLRQCRQLIDSLAKCSLPFQCAHGRPSLAPVINLNTLAKRCPSLATPFPHLTALKLKLNANRHN